MKICLFGGTFDPPHIGHLLIAQTICEVESFDKILFIPAYTPSHKKDITPVEHRVEMVKIAIEDNPNFEYSDVDILRNGVSYTIDSILDIKQGFGLKEEEIYYLMGSDSLIDLKNWKNPKKILNKCNVVVAIRPGFRPSDIPNWILQKVHFSNVPRFELSSRKIRSRWKKDLTIRYMVTLPIWEYINKNNLYDIKG
ncbi:MAG: nicotinate (nicotinamide) nucleotide adenylyltransferase [Flavobacteriaceae bacterium TMED184]|nr:MAG: nicotinate (nicotinamide) nucleotide adenylyltransferase [Flavobacteriaceae bacterium TMED184]|tara:strand:- start:9028 stop:9615 length:588 start_codon:yes stop_codon:yes gene_type:complete